MKSGPHLNIRRATMRPAGWTSLGYAHEQFDFVGHEFSCNSFTAYIVKESILAWTSYP